MPDLEMSRDGGSRDTRVDRRPRPLHASLVIPQQQQLFMAIYGAAEITIAMNTLWEPTVFLSVLADKIVSVHRLKGMNLEFPVGRFRIGIRHRGAACGESLR